MYFTAEVPIWFLYVPFNQDMTTTFAFSHDLRKPAQVSTEISFLTDVERKPFVLAK